jgi:hypothetical protein
MGLTIHYGLHYNGDEPEQIVTKLRDYALQLPFNKVGNIVHLKGNETGFEQYRKTDGDLMWLLIQAGMYVKKLNYSFGVSPLEVYAFTTDPGDGSEVANFGLCRYPKSRITSEFGKLPTRKGTGWHWHSFCKTQYANEYGLDNFVKCHTLVIGMLDSAKHLGILKEVSDESDYWKNRSIEKLVKSIGEWDIFIAKFAGQLKDSVTNQGMSIEAPILNRSNFEQLEIGIS